MYETVENRRPGVLAKKLKIVEGDVMQLELGQCLAVTFRYFCHRSFLNYCYILPLKPFSLWPALLRVYNDTLITDSMNTPHY